MLLLWRVGAMRVPTSEAKMKENVLDVLMYLFENYMDKDVEREPDPESLKVELLEAGFPKSEINKAFAWLEGLTERHQSVVGSTQSTPNSLRLYTDLESEKLDVDCRGFVLFLEQCGILDTTNRELVIDRVMALDTQEIDLEQLKWIILMVLFNLPGQEAAYASLEDLVFEGVTGSLH